MQVLPESVCKAAIGRYLASFYSLRYCHVRRITALDLPQKTITAVVEFITRSGRRYRKTVICRYLIDGYGILTIAAHDVRKEEGHARGNPASGQSLPGNRKGLHAEAGGNEDL